MFNLKSYNFWGGYRGPILIALFILLPFVAKASFFDYLHQTLFPIKKDSLVASTNLQTLALLEGADTIATSTEKADRYDVLVNHDALLAESGPLGTVVDIPDYTSDQISLYVVHKGDTLSQVAKMFKVSVNTIVWANNLNRSQALAEGQQLTILPITGVKHVVKAGDTLASIAKKYDGDVEEVALYNDLNVGAKLVVGTEIIVPNGEIAETVPAKNITKVVSNVGKTIVGYFMRPIKGGRKTQGIHGHNGVDLASSVGSEIYASASGVVIISKMGGWNGGYGNYVVIKHNNGTQTLYAHMLRTNVSVGQTVQQGQMIGYLGNTGNSSGPHVHFEIRGAANPF